MTLPVLIAAASIAFQDLPAPTEAACNAAVIWERMIRARGGRERFEQLRSFHILGTMSFGFLKRSKLIRSDLLIAPDRHWTFFDPGSDMFARTLSLFSFSEGNIYYVTDGPTPPPMSDSERSAWFFMPWMLYVPGLPILRPELGACSVLPDGTTRVAARLAGADYTYFVGDDSYLPDVVTVRYKTALITHRFRDYREVDGFTLPSYHWEHDKGLAPLRLKMKYEVNPSYDRSILTSPPAITDGPDAWKPSAKQRRLNLSTTASAVVQLNCN